MKWQKRYNIDLNTAYAKHLEGYSLPELAIIFKVPRSTLARYFKKAGYQVYFNRHRVLLENMSKLMQDSLT